MTTTYSLTAPMIHQDSLGPNNNSANSSRLSSNLAPGATVTVPAPASKFSTGGTSNNNSSNELEYSYPTSDPSSSVPPAYIQAEATRKRRFVTIIVMVVIVSILVCAGVGVGVYLATRSNNSSSASQNPSAGPSSTKPVSSSKSTSSSLTATTDSSTSSSTSTTTTSTSTTSTIKFTPTPAPQQGQRFIVKNVGNGQCVTGSSQVLCDPNDTFQQLTAIVVTFGMSTQIYWQQAASEYCWNMYAFNLHTTNCDFNDWKSINYNKAIGQIQDNYGRCLSDDLSIGGNCGTFQIIYI